MVFLYSCICKKFYPIMFNPCIGTLKHPENITELSLDKCVWINTYIQLKLLIQFLALGNIHLIYWTREIKSMH